MWSTAVFLIFSIFYTGECGFARIGRSDLCAAWDSPNELLTVSVKNPKPIREEQDCWLIETGEKDFAYQPTVIYANAEYETNYTLVFHGYVKLRWLISNIPGEDLAKGDLSKGLVLHKFLKLDTNNPEGEKFKIAVYKQTVAEIKGDYEKKTISEFRFDWGKHLCGTAASLCFYN